MTQLQDENARLRAEVQRLQAAAMSSHPNHFNTQDPRYGPLTWQEWGNMRSEKAFKLELLIDDAVDQLQSARRDIRMLSGTPAYTRPLIEAHNAMCGAEAVLEDRVEDEEESVSEESEQAEEEGDI